MRLPHPLYGLYERRLAAGLRGRNLPRHVGIILDGNRRWARANAPGQELVVGYRAGAHKLKQFIGWCEEVGIPIVTLWVLSTENLERSGHGELAPLLDVIRDLVVDLAADGTRRVQVVGDLNLLPAAIADDLRAASGSTEAAGGMHVNVAVSYGGRHELRDAVRSLLAAEASKGTDLTELLLPSVTGAAESAQPPSGDPVPESHMGTGQQAGPGR